MTSVSWIALTLALVAALVDWIAVARRVAVLEYGAKPTATLALLVVAASLDVSRDASWWWLLASLVACALGDVWLMLPRDAFVPGLASFAVAQAMFAVSFTVGGIEASRLVLGLLVVVPVAVLLARRFVAALHHLGRRELVVPVVGYIVVISTMAVAAIGGATAVAIAGAVMFMVSDSLIAESRFVNTRPWHPVGIMVTYHLALTGLVLGML